MTRSAREIAAVLGRPAPTDEQVEVIEAPLAPGVVVAGAGSGKTETMSARVLWLVVNGLVRPEEVLGLTFTRKAAHELGDRVRRRLVQLRRLALLDDEVASAGDATVSTYDAYAGRLVAEHALRLGEEPGRRLVTEAVAWQYATRVAEAYAGEMGDVDLALGTVVEKVLSLHGELTGHLVEPAALVTATERLDAAVRAVPDATRKRGPYAEVLTALGRQQARLQLLPLVEAFRAEKRRHEVLDFGDQAALAAALAQRFPEIGTAERARYRVVLLDEYQDTSHAQLVMLRGLFGAGHPVTAVGDPCQSIYGWRGASAQTLTGFAEHFGPERTRAPVTRTLRTSFRNRAGILRCANALSAPLGGEVPVLRPYDDAPDRVVVTLHETADDEAADLARRVREEWDGAGTGDQDERGAPTIAVLVRKRAQIERIAAALRAEGLPVEVLGVGGLLLTPEVADVVATLQVLADPSRGDALMRLLTGTRWRIGPRDLDALGRWARRLVRLREGGLATDASEATDGGVVGDVVRDVGDGGGNVGGTSRAARPDVAGAADDTIDVEPDEVDERSIVDALDALPRAGWFSALGRARLRSLAAELRGLRSRVAQPLPELVGEVIHTLGLDIEVAAVPGDGRGRADLDAFLDVASSFAESGEDSTLPAFLAYLAAAETEERGLAPGEVEVSDRAVQVLTVHGAKGLEWDVVCVPGLVDGTFPSGGASDKAWLLDVGALPFPLRGDRAGLPSLIVAGLADQQEVKLAFERFALDCGELARTEERRLAYVAVTRARRHLVCSGYRWGSGVRPVEPAAFLTELREVCVAGAGEVAGWADPPVPGAVNPLTTDPVRHDWPYDPLSRRRAAVEAGAQAVRAALARVVDGPARGVDGPGRVVDTGATGPAAATASASASAVPASALEPVDAAPAQGTLFELPALHQPVDERAGVGPPVPRGAAGAAPLPDPTSAARWDRDVTLLLDERARRSWTDDLVVPLPSRLSVSQLVLLGRDPAALARAVRRPMPAAPNPLARRGTAFHAWLEGRWGAPRLVDEHDLPGAADEGAAGTDELVALQEAFLASPWSQRTPVEVEAPFELLLAGVLLRGRADAVFLDADGTLEVVDWKTGAPPRDAAELASRSVQLAAYRLAWARLHGVGLDRVRAAFHHVREGLTIAPVDLLDESGLVALVRSVPAA